MATRLPTLLDRAILFARRGARANDREQTIAAFELALARGATGLHVKAWTTRDGQIVISRDGLARRFPRRRIADVDAAALPPSLVRLDDLYDAVGPEIELRVSLDEPAAGPAVVSIARGRGAAESLWLDHHDLDVLTSWRDHAAEIRLVNATGIGRLPLGAERRAAELASARIDAVSFPDDDWSGGLVTLFHRFEVAGFAEGAHYDRQLVRLIDMGIDGVTGDHVERMAAVAATFD